MLVAEAAHRKQAKLIVGLGHWLVDGRQVACGENIAVLDQIGGGRTLHQPSHAAYGHSSLLVASKQKADEGDKVGGAGQIGGEEGKVAHGEAAVAQRAGG